MFNLPFKINEDFEKYEFLVEWIKDHGVLLETKMWDCSSYNIQGCDLKAIYLYFNSDLLKVIKLVSICPTSERDIITLIGEDIYFNLIK